MKRFLKTPGGVDLYPEVKVEWIRHHNPEMVVTEDGESLTFDLSTYDFVGLHKLMHRLGFSAVRDAGDAAEGAAQSAAERPGARAHALAHHHEATPAMAATLPRGPVDPVPSPAHAVGSSMDPGSFVASVRAAIRSGDELLKQGLIEHPERRSNLKLHMLGGLVAFALLLALLLCCGVSDGSESGASGGRTTTTALPPPARGLDFSSSRVRAGPAYTPLSPVPEMVSPGAIDKNV